MDCFRITGPARLSGRVCASGSKNAALPIMAATLLADGVTTLHGVPDLVDVNTLALLLGMLGVESKRGLDDVWRMATVDALPIRADYDLVRRMRASFCVLGPLVARRGRAVVSLPGGCNIGTRPVDLHLAGLEALGATVRIENGYVIASARSLHGAEIDLRGPRGPTVTGTANVMSAATLARGRTVLRSAATEPEIVDLGRFLIAMGARIDGLGTETIEITGVEQLDGAHYRVIPDRIEVGTLLLAGAITGGDVTVSGVRPEHLTSVLETLVESGAEIECGADEITIRAHDRPRPIRVTALPYPGVPTDLQAQFLALLSLATGQSVVRDEVFPDRFMHVAELNRLGARIERGVGCARVCGVRQLSGATVMASDLRASATLVLAALAARGETVIRRIYHLDRGYEGLERKLAVMGAGIVRETDQGSTVNRSVATEVAA